MKSTPTGIPRRKRLKSYNKKKIIGSFLVIVILLVGVVHFMLKMRRIYRKSKDLQAQKQQTLHELEERSSQLGDQLEKYSSPVGQERMLRERYNITKEGEHEIVLENIEKKEDVKQEQSMSFWKKIFHWFDIVED